MLLWKFPLSLHVEHEVPAIDILYDQEQPEGTRRVVGIETPVVDRADLTRGFSVRRPHHQGRLSLPEGTGPREGGPGSPGPSRAGEE